MHIVIIGPGAVGGYFGAKMAKAGLPVSFMVRNKRYQQLQQTGLQVKSLHGDFIIEPTLVKTAEELEKPDVVLVAVKNYHLEGVLEELSGVVEKGAVVLPLLNGIQHMDVLIERFGKEKVLGGVCYVESTLASDGSIHQTSSMQDIVFGPLSEQGPTWLLGLKETMEQANIGVTLSTSILTDMWKKFAFLVSLSGITTALRSPIGVALADPVTNAFLRNLIDEILAVAAHKQVALPQDLGDEIMNRLAALSPDMTSSMHRDLEKGFPLELESLQGAVLTMAKEAALPTPCMRTLYALLHPFKDGRP